MSDFITDGRPLETPAASADESYAQTPPTLGRAFRAMVGETSVVGTLARANERNAENGYPAIGDWDTSLAPQAAPKPPEPTLPPDEINKLYAPRGTTITDKPMTTGLARIVGRQKQEEMDRENVLARYSRVTSAPVEFGVGVAAFLADPLNLATMFLPGMGEETAAVGIARLGLATEGAVGRGAVRALAGAATGAAAQAPLTALRYGLGQGEASDYDLRSAMKDMAFASAGAAILHAGFGALGDRIRTRRTTPGNLPEPPEGGGGGGPGFPPGGAGAAEDIDAAAVLNSNAETRDAAMRSSVSQVVTGRPVEVADVFGQTPEQVPPGVPGAPPPDHPLFAPIPRQPATLSAWIKARGGIKDDGGEVLASLGTTRGRPGLISKTGASADDLALAAWEAGYFPGAEARPTANELLRKLDDDLRGSPQFSEHDATELAAHREALDRNSEIDRYANELGIDPKGLSHREFWAKVSDRLSTEEVGRRIDAQAAAHEAEITAADARAREFLESRGEAWEPDHVEEGRRRSLEDLENERRQEETARGPLAGTPDVGPSGPAGGNPPAVQAGGGPRGRGPGDGGIARGSVPGPGELRAIAERQQQLYRDGSAAGLTQDELIQAEQDLLGTKEGGPAEGAKPEAAKPQAEGTEKAPDPELDALEQAARDREASGAILTADERAEMIGTANALSHAELYETAARQAAQCLIEGGA